MVSGLYFSIDGKEFGKLGEILEVELTAEKEPEADVGKNFYNSKEFSCEFQMSETETENMMKYIVYGGDRGRYNGYVLHRDGYLSPKNAWIRKGIDI